MIKKFLKIFTILCNGLTFSVMAAEEAVEMYSDEKPKCKFITMVNLAGSSYAKEVGKSFVPVLSFKNFLIGNEFVIESLSVDAKVLRVHDKQEFWCVRKNIDSGDIFFIQMQSEISSDVPMLQKVKFDVSEEVYKINKWDVPRKITFLNEKEETLNEMSWKFIDCALHSYVIDFSEDKEGDIISSPLAELVFPIIRQNSLKDTIQRLLIIFNQDLSFKVYYLFDEEKNDVSVVTDSIKMQFEFNV